MKDIAQMLNVSIVTVSKVLNGNSSISESTRQRVLECARQLDYRTNLAAKGLVTGQTRLIGLIVPDLVHGFFSSIAGGISDVLRHQGYGLIIASSRDDKELERQEIELMRARSVDALIVATCQLIPGAFDSIAQNLPLVLLDRQLANHVPVRYVGTDDLVAGRLATQHLVDLGRRRIAHIAGPNISPGQHRESAFREVLEEAGIRVPASYVVHLPQNEESNHVAGAQCMAQLLRAKPRPDAVFCYNDPTAMGAMATILDAGLRIPEDIALVGCGHTFYNAFMRVSLTSIDQNAPMLGHEAAKSALSAIKERKNKAAGSRMEVLVEPTMIVGGSTKGCCDQPSDEQRQELMM